MKRNISILIIAVILISLSACKRPPEGFDEVAAADSLEATQAIDIQNKTDDEVTKTSNSDNQGKPVDFDNENRLESDETVNAEADNNSSQNNTEQPNSEKQAGKENLQGDDSQENDNDVKEADPYLPVALGYVEAVEENGEKKYIAKQDEFTIELPITLEIRNKAFTDTNKDSLRATFLCFSNTDFGGANDLEELESYFPKDKYVIVRGEFLPEFGTSVVKYRKWEIFEGERMGYCVDDSYTRYNFKVDKIYTPCDKFNVSDTIPVINSGTIEQKPDGTYFASSRYFDFAGESLEKRTFIMALRKDTFEKCNGYLISRNIFMNAYEEVWDNTGDKNKQIAYDILQKYN